MTNLPRHPYYRLFQKFALGVGVITALAGFGLQNKLVGMAGVIILVHGLVAALFIAIDDRRMTYGDDK